MQTYLLNNLANITASDKRGNNRKSKAKGNDKIKRNNRNILAFSYHYSYQYYMLVTQLRSVVRVFAGTCSQQPYGAFWNHRPSSHLTRCILHSPNDQRPCWEFWSPLNVNYSPHDGHPFFAVYFSETLLKAYWCQSCAGPVHRGAEVSLVSKQQYLRHIVVSPFPLVCMPQPAARFGIVKVSKSEVDCTVDTTASFLSIHLELFYPLSIIHLIS